MYGSREDARSDLMLSAAAYLFGPLFVTLFLGALGVMRIPVVREGLQITLPLVYTVLVPVLLIRYRGQAARDFGLGGGPDPSAIVGLLASVPIVVGGLAAAAVLFGDVALALPMFPAAGQTAASSVVVTLARLTTWVGVLFLALYLSVKAQDAFGSSPTDLTEAVRKIVVVIGILAGVTALIRLLALPGGPGGRAAIAVLLGPIAVAAAVALVVRRVGVQGSVLMPALVVPVVILALGAFRISFRAAALMTGLYGAALYAGIGLIVGLLVVRTGRGAGVIMLGIVLATLTRFDIAGFL